MIESLSHHLLERCSLRTGPSCEDPKFVLHWIRAALRFEENPTFDVARLIANQMELPLLVYHGIDERYPHASYRHHKFLLEGARDLEKEAAEMGVDYLLHVSRKGHRQPVLKLLSEDAAVIVTDLVDLDPWSDWSDAIAKMRTLIEVDAHCVLPRQVFGRSVDRPFKFKNSTKRMVNARKGVNWPVCDVPITRMSELYDPPFAPVSAHRELERDGGVQLLSQCEIDPTVMPVTDVCGGTKFAKRKWENYVENGLKRYHRTRNDASNRDGVSGISPWLHYGMIAATKVVREAIDAGGKGADKFLDEMLIFREQAYHHCHELQSPRDWSSLPEWARISWRERIQPMVNKKERDLETGDTGDSLWDSAQMGLVRHGVMHNNVRMTWGKGVARWIQDPNSAMNITQCLNDRYALDGRDPNSIAGVMWCYGLFDRPFDPPSDYMGRIRRRSTEGHASRLDMKRYRDWVGAPTNGRMMDIGIVGSGISGMFAGQILSRLGHKVTIYDKGWRPSGRLAYRQTEDGSMFSIGSINMDGSRNWMNRFQWDLGNSAKPFKNFLDELSKDQEVNYNTRIVGVKEDAQGVLLWGSSDSQEVQFNHSRVIVAVPIEQATRLLEEGVLSGESAPYWVAWGPGHEGSDSLPEGWSIRNVGNGTIELRLDPNSSEEHINRTKDEMASLIPTKAGFSPVGWSSHLWRYGRPISGPARVVHHGRIAFIGDAFGTPLGTIGAALDSAARAVADLHLMRGWNDEIDAVKSRQSNLMDW